MSDLISRQDAINIANDLIISVSGYEQHNHAVNIYSAELMKLPSPEPERLTDDDFETIRIHLNAWKEKLCNQHRWGEAEEYQRIIDRFMAFASAEPKQDREFINLTVRNSNGRPYYSIIYLEVDDNGVGHDFEGYSSYSLDVISDYLKKYFMPSADPERKKGEWIKVWRSGFNRKFGYCNQCKMSHPVSNFCPNCGADMRGKTND